MAVRVDHAVINVLTGMDAAVERFRALGFAPTPRGYHSLGSINHLMMFERDYLELVGIEPGATKVREEVASAPIGLNGLVFATDDARALHRRLRAQGVPVLDPVDFSRPVMVDGVEREAAFTTVRVHPDYVPGGRVYYCEHKTPELVWRPEWLAQRNGSDGLAEFVVVAQDLPTQAERYARLLDGAVFVPAAGEGEVFASWDGFRLSLMSRERYDARYGTAGCARAARDGDCMGALALRTHSLAAARACLADDLRAGRAVDHGDRLTVAAAGLWDCVLEFVGPRPGASDRA